MAAPVSPPVPVLRRWRWPALAVAAAVALLIWLWPEGRDADPRPSARPAAAKIKPRRVISFGPDGWKVGAPRLGPIAVAPPQDGLVRVTGTVLDQLSRKPVPDVEVVFADGTTESSVVSDLAGRYSIDLLPGRYRPFARGDGVISAAPPVRERLPARPRPEQVAVARLDLAAALDLSASTDGVDLEVMQAGKIVGRVLDRDGRPIAGAVVRAFPTDDYAAARPVLGTDVAETDDAGGFTLEVAATMQRLEAFHDRYGGVAEFKIVPVEAGQTATAELTLVAGCVIAGRIVRVDGQPPGEGALERGMSDSDIHATYFPDGEFNADGTFVWTTSEEITLFLRAWPWKSPPSPARRFDCKDGARFTDVVFEIPRAEPDLAGRVVDASGRPVPFAFVDVNGESDGTMNQQERADADGNWAVYALPHGAYRVSATAEGLGAVVTRVAAPRRDVELRMSGAGALAGEVAGISDGSFTLTANVCVVNGDLVAIELRRVVEVRGGRFRLDGVPACEMVFTATRGATTLRAQAVVPAGGVGTLELDFPDDAPVLVRGTVRGPDGRPVAEAMVLAVGQRPEPTTTMTDADGRFSLEARAGDTITVSAQSGYTSHPLDNHGPSTVELTLTLTTEPDLDHELLHGDGDGE